MATVPQDRIRAVNNGSPRGDGDYVLYWMIANRRVRWNFSLERAIEWAATLRKPLLILEALRCDYPWASDRLHRFVLQGMGDNRAALKSGPALYYAYVEPTPGHGRGLLEALAERACVVVTDDFPCFVLPQMVERAGQLIGVKVEAVDSNGLLPMRSAAKVFARAHDFRRFLQRELKPHLSESPKSAPFQGRRLPPSPPIPRSMRDRWPEASDSLLKAGTGDLAPLPIDHSICSGRFDGGMFAATRQLDLFLGERLTRYGDERNHPDADATSGLSPYLHFGHLAAHEVFSRIAERERWSPAALGDATKEIGRA
ncbi:MAG: deoxyribodipyrimidine photolyase, partial [Planctomycetaceae bacterium]